MDMQETLIARWFQETQMQDREMASEYLVKADWQIDVAVEQYTSDINQWRAQTQVHDVSTEAKWIRRWDFDISRRWHHGRARIQHSSASILDPSSDHHGCTSASYLLLLWVLQHTDLGLGWGEYFERLITYHSSDANYSASSPEF